MKSLIFDFKIGFVSYLDFEKYLKANIEYIDKKIYISVLLFVFRSCQKMEKTLRKIQPTIKTPHGFTQSLYSNAFCVSSLEFNHQIVESVLGRNESRPAVTSSKAR